MARLTLGRYGRWPSPAGEIHAVQPPATRSPTVTYWPEYDARVKRGSLTVWMTEEAIAAWQAPASLALRLVFHQPLRQTEGLP